MPQNFLSRAERHGKDWDYVTWAHALKGHSVLLAEADDRHSCLEATARILALCVAQFAGSAVLRIPLVYAQIIEGRS